MSPDRLVHMANQIAAFFAGQHGDAVAATADHLAKFWDPRMRRDILAHDAAGGAGLTPIAREAVHRLAVGAGA